MLRVLLLQDVSSALLAPYLSSSNVVVFSWFWCPYCVKVKWWLWWKGYAYKDYLIERMGPEGATIHEEIKKVYQHETVPAVFVKGQFVGGCDDVLKLGKLDA